MVAGCREDRSRANEERVRRRAYTTGTSPDG